MNTLGLVCALTTFLNVWFGHVAVRYIEARVVSIRLPMMAFASAGLILETGALLAGSRPLSAALGIMGIILMWDAFEFARQQKRVMKGHAPANPNNPRHRQILAEQPNATTLNWLKREPLGRALTESELRALREAGR